MKGTVFGVGVGPGDPELITLKAVRVIRECEVIAVPGTRATASRAYRIALDVVPEIAHKETLALPTPMTKDHTALLAAHRANALTLEALLNEGKCVAYLTLGDPTIYSTFSYLQRQLSKDGYATCVISGVTSFCAAAARLGTPIVEGQEALHVLPASQDRDVSLEQNDTYVFLKGGHHAQELKDRLRARERTAWAIQNCGTASERVYATIDEIPSRMDYFSLIVSSR